MSNKVMTNVLPKCRGSDIYEKGGVAVACGEECEMRVSQSQKNPNRAYYCCPIRDEQGGHGFYGWVGDVPMKKSPNRHYLPKVEKPERAAAQSSDQLLNLAAEVGRLHGMLEAQQATIDMLVAWWRDCTGTAAPEDDTAVFEDPEPAQEEQQPELPPAKRQAPAVAATFSLNLPAGSRYQPTTRR